jgi:RNA polymerase sigma factor (sigma-70 family)
VSERFPPTRHSILEGVRSEDRVLRERSFARLVESYWEPVYKYLRVQWRAGVEDAQDLTQDFFASALEEGTFGRFDPSRARFRTYLRVCLDRHAQNERKAARRLKRGGGVAPVPLDVTGAEGDLKRIEPRAAEDPETFFEREWIRSLFARALRKLEQASIDRGRRVEFEAFRRYDIDGAGSPERPTYAEIAAALDLPVTQVTNHLHAMRRLFRETVLTILREETASEEEFREEARAVLGFRAP